jgi:hypothetical protein
MREFVPTADDLDEDAQYIVDGTLLPCWSWKAYPKLYSGKHKTTGVNLQLACSIYGRPPFMDLGSGQREPSRQLLPRRFRGAGDDRSRELDG